MHSKRLFLRVPAFLSLVLSLCAHAQDLPTEQAVRAAIVFNFLKFSDFPQLGTSKSAWLQMCVAVSDPRQAQALAELAGRKVAGRELIVSPFTEQATDCNVLYVDTRQRWAAADTHPALQHALTISAYPGFMADGGMIEIAMQKDRIRFDINLAEGRRLGFRFSPQMLRLARRINE